MILNKKIIIEYKIICINFYLAGLRNYILQFNDFNTIIFLTPDKKIY